MSYRDGKSHFFGNHPGGEMRQNTDQEYRGFIMHYQVAAKTLPKDISIVNATPGSALPCFPITNFETAISVGSPQ